MRSNSCAAPSRCAARWGLVSRGTRMSCRAHTVQMRWRDLDGLGHVNHTVVLTYLEEGRDAFLASCGIARDEYVVGRCSVTFRSEIDPAFEAVTVAVRRARARALEPDHERADPRRQRTRSWSMREFAIVLWDQARAWLASDHRRGARLAGRSGGRADEMNRLEQRPGGPHVRDHRRRRLPRQQPEHPVHDRGDRRVDDRGGGGGRDGRAPARARGRRHARAAARSCSSTRSTASAPAATC